MCSPKRLLCPVLLLTVISLVIWTCDGEGPTGPAVASVGVSPDVAELGVGETVQLTAVARDAGGNAVSDARFTWSSTSEAVARVDQTGLVTGVGEGEARITATSGGVSGSAAATVLGNFQPPGDTEVGGELRVNNFEIPAGVTVRVTRDLVVNARRAVEIAGSLVGDCVGVTVNGGGDVTITGEVNNSCTGALPDVRPTLLIVGNGQFTSDSTTRMRSSGDIEITMDTTLTDADFAEPGAAAARAAARGAGGTAGADCLLEGLYVSVPLKAEDGRAGVTGGPGTPGKGYKFTCPGILFLSHLVIQAQDGGDGGPGNHESSTAARAEGGAGGDGGQIVLRSAEFVALAKERGFVQGGSVDLITGFGGQGGGAVAMGLENSNLPKGAPAEAKGGKGGDSGLFQIKGLAGDCDGNFPLTTILLGKPGPGGTAEANAAKGRDADDVREAGEGGDATAIGGMGGNSTHPPADCTSALFGRFLPSGIPEGATGGEAKGTSGKGGTGSKQFPSGGNGGNVFVSGGNGGNARVVNVGIGAPQGKGGNGGKAFVAGGMGGDGFNDCGANELLPGGPGGGGGTVEGSDGLGGNALLDTPKGEPGGVEINEFGNGGNGGDGVGPGPGGPPGTNMMEPAGGVLEIGSFAPGQPGDDCPQHSGPYDVEITVADNPGTNPNHEQFFGLTQVTRLDVRAEFGGSIIFDGPAPWVPISGDLSADGSFDLRGIGRFGDISNVRFTFVGTLRCTQALSGTLTVGTQEELPGGQRIDYNVTGQRAP